MVTPPRYRACLTAGLLLATLPGVSVLAAIALTPAAQTPAAQTTAGAAAGPKNLVGTVTAKSADSLQLKLESGSEATVSISAQTKLLRTAPGEKTLKGATVIQMDDLESGDRVLVLHITAGDDATHYSAAAVVVMKQADIAQVHATESEDWQKRGVGGIVKSIDPAGSGGGASAGSGAGAGPTIVVGTAQPGRTLSIHVTPTTTIRRYAADSINFADARAATLADIHPGDQLRARGDRAADGTDVTAVEIVAGSFRNVAGTIVSIDAANHTVTVTDLATKKPVTLKVTAETQMRKLPAEMAQRLAARTSQTGAGPQGPPGNGPGGGARAGAAQDRGAGSAAAGGPPGGSAGGLPGGAAGGSRPPADAGSSAGAGRGRGDAASMLQHAPVVTLAELKKGDALMVVAARGGGGVSDAATAITLIAGVEPLLESSSGASQSLFSASWNLSGSGGAEGAAQ